MLIYMRKYCFIIIDSRTKALPVLIIFIISFLFKIFKHTFVFDFGVIIPITYGKVMKRESGVNPEQTRCCKLY